MGFEIDYIPVGDGEKAGDAIAVRFGNLFGPRTEQKVIVFDGGIKESGEQLVEHINRYYKTNEIDLAISTHPDADHASGLNVVLEKMKVGGLLMHRPWEYAGEIKYFFKDKRVTASGLEKKLEESLQHASDLEELAKEKGVAIVEPFQGLTGYDGILHILGPSESYYKELLPLFRSTPEPVDHFGIFTPVRKAAEEAVRWIEDQFHLDLLDDDEDTTSAENNTSVIALLNIDGHKLLFTGDAGKTALLNAINYAATNGIPLSDLRFLDVPHHGSKRNISSKILRQVKAGTAYVSAPVDSKKHPAKKITNALKKHGSEVFVTRGVSLCHRHQAPDRGWSSVKPEPFHIRVEE